ncbi:Alpha/Beta hydrolase protein [Thelonectria olida]|uniref:Alpha/Beta hydrolase protein n=1 Tax=Thelonectria olida TaxID=1576542 RepID=A0A9P8W365_9HYPO|nr:Alpha/Beta hydrolase protein [Thelonectria olida]
MGDVTNSLPLLICFHGSDDSCASWAPLAELLCTSYRVLLWDRGPHHPNPHLGVQEMLKYLKQARLSPPYVLIAHSYGGTFARLFLQQRSKDVAGMVLVETGQETELVHGLEQEQYKKRVLGDRPLVVVRGNTLIGKWKQYEEALAAAEGNVASPSLLAQKQLLDATDKEDERLKKAQLALSHRHRYVHIPDCGHNVVQQRPEIVAAEVRWVMDHLQRSNSSLDNRPSVLRWLRKLGSCI